MIWYRCNMVIWPQSAVILAPYFWSRPGLMPDPLLVPRLDRFKDGCMLSCRNCDPGHDHVSFFLLLMHFIFTDYDLPRRWHMRRWGGVWCMIGCDDGVIKTRQRIPWAHPTSPRQPAINIQMMLDRGWWKMQTSPHTRCPAPATQLLCIIPIKYKLIAINCNMTEQNQSRNLFTPH